MVNLVNWSEHSVPIKHVEFVFQRMLGNRPSIFGRGLKSFSTQTIFLFYFVIHANNFLLLDLLLFYQPVTSVRDVQLNRGFLLLWSEV